MRRLAPAIVAACALLLPVQARAFDAALEAKNFAKVSERQAYVTGTPAFQARLQQQNVVAPIEYAQLKLADPERSPSNVCPIRANECAGDVRFYDWEDSGYGIMTPVLFTGRSGAVISGAVWGTAAGPAQRPAIVMTTGSVQAPETLYWGLAAVFAKAGYVVLTYDVQGQGRSDTLGEAPDQQEGVPSQAGQPFFDGTEDALDFMLSTPGQPYDPRPSCGNANGGVGTDHSPKQDRRVASGLNAAFNPMHSLVDPSRIGVTGHSLGAGAVSFVGQADPRVDAFVAYDNLAIPGGAGGFGTTPDCPANPGSRATPAITKPALGISNDYGLTPTAYTADPAPESKNLAFSAYEAAGVDAMQVNIRGGTHYESSLIPGNTVPNLGQGTWRGQDLVAWYTLGWLDKFVKGDAGADARLLSDRWCDDAQTRGVDLNDDGNMFSFYFRSRHDFGLAGGGDAVSTNMRGDCSGASDPAYDFVAAANTADDPGPAPGGDSDGDGVPDSEDSCPTVSGAANGGCPPPPTAGTSGGGSSGSDGSGGSTLSPGACANPKRGTRGNDFLRGSFAGDRILGLRGHDRIKGRAGADCLRGNRGNDLIKGGAGRDLISGSAGRDRLVGGAGRDFIKGGLNRDVVKVRDGARDVVNCGPGRDVVVADKRDKVHGCEVVKRR